MKKIFTLLLTLITVFAFGGFRAPVIGLGHSFKPLVETPQLNRSAVFKKLNTSGLYDDDDEYCRKYKGMTIAGGVLLGAGIGAFSGGIVMIRGGINYFGDDELKPLGLIAGGVVVTILGLGMTVTGSILLGIGATKLRRECKKSDQGQSFYLVPKPTGVGFAMRF